MIMAEDISAISVLPWAGPPPAGNRFAGPPERMGQMWGNPIRN